MQREQREQQEQQAQLVLEEEEQQQGTAQTSTQQQIQLCESFFAFSALMCEGGESTQTTSEKPAVWGPRFETKGRRERTEDHSSLAEPKEMIAEHCRLHWQADSIRRFGGGAARTRPSFQRERKTTTTKKKTARKEKTAPLAKGEAAKGFPARNSTMALAP